MPVVRVTHVFEPSIEYGPGRLTREHARFRELLFSRNLTLNQFAFPREDERGPQDGKWLVGCVERAEAQLASIRFDRP
jgi:hypothetical protein